MKVVIQNGKITHMEPERHDTLEEMASVAAMTMDLLSKRIADIINASINEERSKGDQIC